MFFGKVRQSMLHYLMACNEGFGFVPTLVLSVRRVVLRTSPEKVEGSIFEPSKGS